MIFRFLDFELDVELYEIRRDGERLPAERRVIDLLLYFVRNRDRVISREEFLEGVWLDVAVRERIVDQMIYGARKMLGDDANRPQIIETVRGRGWRFIADVIESALRRWPQGSLPPGEIPFVGRKNELEALEASLDAGREGHGSMVLITGEPGIGKSRLIEEFADRASRQGVRTYLGRCPEVDGAPPFWPWTQLLRAHRLAIGEAAWDAIIERTPQVGQLSRELDEQERWRTRVRPSQVGDDRFLLYDTITRFWLDIADEAPLLLLLDDLHRADESSVQLLRHLAGEVRSAGLVVVGTARPWDEGVARELVRPGSATGLPLARLTSDEVERFLELASMVSPQLASTEPRLAGGNPMLIRSLAMAGSQRATVPRRLTSEFTSQLPQRSQLILAVASAIGTEFSSSLVAAVSGSSLVETRSALEPAAQVGVIIAPDPGRYEFAHLMLRDAMYNALPTHVSSQLHSRIAAVMVEISADPGVIAYHYRRSAETGDVQMAFDYSLEAGTAAVSRLAIEEGLEHLRAAERLCRFVNPSRDQLLNLELSLGEAEVRSGQRAEGSRRIQRVAGVAYSTQAAKNLAKAALAMSPGSLAIDTGVVDATAVQALQAALSLSSQHEPGTRARLRARLALALHAQPESYELRKELLIAALQDANGMAAKADVLVATVAALWRTGSWGDQRTKLQLAIRLAAQVGESELEGIAQILTIAIEFSAGSGHASRLAMNRLEELLAEKEITTLAWYAPLYRFTTALEQGDMRTAERNLEAMRAAVGATGGANGENAYGGGKFALHFHRGEFEKAAAVGKAGVDRFPRLHAWRCALGLSLARAGRIAEAETLAEQVAPVILQSEQRDLMWLASAASLGDLCADIGAESFYADVEAALRPYSGQFVGVGYAVFSWGAVDRVRGRLLSRMGSRPEAIDALEKARSVHSDAFSAVWQSYNSLDLAVALALTGAERDARRANQEAQSAVALAKAMGQGFVEREALRLRDVLRNRFGAGLSQAGST